ncbi:GNAT family N-acetyltransferase [Polaromonas sp.]|uniref:GNAT family N-acetyltransferase n=1 Tax=Polaromonas sp. TaxID=1869339 RepID=UPI002FC852F6
MRSTESILIRRFNPSDVESFYAAVRASIDELSYWMPWCYPAYSLADAQAWIQFTEKAWASGTEYPLGIFDVRSGAVVGGTGLNHINKVYRIANIGYWVSSLFTNRGVARTAARLVADIGFKDRQFTRLEIVVLSNNPASQRVAQAVGARLEGKARNRLYFHGKPHEAFVNSLIPEDLASTQGSPQPQPSGG